LAGPKAPASGLYLVKVNYPQSFKEENNENI
jgi:tRNA U38,U39,U40 pseudouridine synthase TruA